METCYILEPSIFIESLGDTTYTDDNVIFSYGFKDAATVETPYGGMSKQIIKTGGTPTECTIFSFESNTGVSIDEDEGISLILVDNLVDMNRVTPFEEIHFTLGIKESDPVYVMGTKTTTGGGERYAVPLPAANIKQVMNWFRENLNNTPQIRLKCYPTAP